MFMVNRFHPLGYKVIRANSDTQTLCKWEGSKTKKKRTRLEM